MLNPLTPNDPYRGRTAPLTYKRYILYIYSTNIGTEYFKHGIYSPFFSIQNAACFIILTYLVPVLFTFYIQGVLKLKKIIPAPKCWLLRSYWDARSAKYQNLQRCLVLWQLYLLLNLTYLTTLLLGKSVSRAPIGYCGEAPWTQGSGSWRWWQSGSL